MQHIEAQPHTRVRPSLWAGRLALGRFVLTLSIKSAQEQNRPGAGITNHLARLRQERGMARQELAERLQIHPATLTAIERGSYIPSLGLALRLSNVFELPIEAIFLSPNATHLV
jgi:DNA-binding XRE family transcriptional regulator